MNTYDPTEAWPGQAYQDGGHTYFHNSLIWGENLTNVSITGTGMINGGGLVRSDGLLDQMCGFSNWNPTNRTPPLEMNAPPARLGNKAIALKLCRNVLLRDITIFHGGHFAILVTGCNNLTVDNVTIDTDRDGIDLDCCCNTTVSNCRINSPNDDGLCPKSSFALGRNVITENLTIANCQVSGFQEGTLLDGTMKPGHGTGRIKFGTEANGGFRNVTIANCTFRDCCGLALEEVDGGTMENISINNISMMDVVGYPIYITTGRRDRGPDVTSPSRVANIFISNVVATGIDPMSGIQLERHAQATAGEYPPGKHSSAVQGRRDQVGCIAPAPGTGHGLSGTVPARHHARLRAVCAARPRAGTGEHHRGGREARFAPADGLFRCGRSGDRQFQGPAHARGAAGQIRRG